MTNKVQNSIGVIGAGTMGAGIAQAAAGAGWPVILFDIEQTLVDQAKDSITKRFVRLVEKKRISQEEAAHCQERITTTISMDDLSDCDLIVEAIVEDFDIKTKVLTQVGSIARDAIIATNTSSLSVTDLGEASGIAERVVGMHFFNPAPIMPLVEIIRGEKSSESAIQRATLLAEAWGKTVVQVSDTPGFIVNRVARPYYLESWRIIEDGLATVDQIDDAMQALGEFKMGPFMLTDLIGQDINVATTRSVWQRLGNPSRLAPSAKQESLVERGNLGRKSGCGAYAHDDKDNNVPAVFVEPQELEISENLTNAINNFCLEATCTSGSMLEKYIFARVLGGIMNEAMWATTEHVASSEDIDTAMKMGTNYPQGPLEWAAKIGIEKIHCLLAALNETVADDRFAAPPFGTVSAN
ncbi:MAG: 3-hydroxybutyryl-CoA dehydrogenase [Planctomycetes bacterium]|nr:3-hydroxybutyryl-CoA dehydrogenase [Planctomycetota bacterium]